MSGPLLQERLSVSLEDGRIAVQPIGLLSSSCQLLFQMVGLLPRDRQFLLHRHDPEPARFGIMWATFGSPELAEDGGGFIESRFDVVETRAVRLLCCALGESFKHRIRIEHPW